MLNNLAIDPGYILILMMAMIMILFILHIKTVFKINRFMQKYKSFMKGKDGVSLEKTILRNINDIEMLSTVGCGIAMGNASDEVKKYAHKVTESVHDDGVAVGIKEYVCC